MKLHDRIEIEINKRNENDCGSLFQHDFELKLGGVRVFKSALASIGQEIPEKDMKQFAINNSGRFLVACGNYLLRTERKMKKKGLL